MRKYILFFMLLAFSMGAAAQGVVRRNVKQEQTKPKPTPKPKSATKPKPAAKPTPKPSAEAAGYNVSFVCDVSNATLNIDGAIYNSASGTYFLQTGKHTIKVSADGYEDYASSITVNSAHRSFNISMVKLRNINKTFTVNGVSFEMVYVEGGTFMMGCDDEYRSKPQHQVTLSSYYIGKTEVTQELWETVMGNNPSSSMDLGPNKPVIQISWDDCQEFIGKLNNLTGMSFCLPTEAEWEYAARGGNQSRDYKYSGSNNLDDVGWYENNSEESGYKCVHIVGTKQSNELGIFDMSGNVDEWCEDWYGAYSADSQTNPKGAYSGKERVVRGGNHYQSSDDCKNTYRYYVDPNKTYCFGGLRLALSADASASHRSSSSYGQANNYSKGIAKKERVTANGVSFNMVYVEGGTFQMGYDDSQLHGPMHQVTLDTYHIGETEVTQELWVAVMGSNPCYNHQQSPQKPVTNVNWQDCHTFINKLNAITGKRFRLPTEAEWEFAFRGGNKSRGYTYSGSNNLDEVAWNEDNSDGDMHPVATKSPNELGIYDMSGNVDEWCEDWYGPYNSYAQRNPKGPSTGNERTIRGGSYCNNEWVMTRGVRRKWDPNKIICSFGLRLVY